MDKWDELRTALYVHELGTITAASEALGVHRATVIRHIDNLESNLGVTLFIRHSQGYTATAPGLEAIAAATQARRLFEDALAKARGESDAQSSQIIVATMASVFHLIAPAIEKIVHSHPDVRIEIRDSVKFARLELGEAHLAIRTGAKPTQADYIVQRLTDIGLSFFASDTYIQRYGQPLSIEDCGDHIIIGPTEAARMPFAAWARRTIPNGNLRVRTTGPEVALATIRAGAGIGILPNYLGDSHAELVRVLPVPDNLNEPLWLVTHRDNHKNKLIQLFSRHLKDISRDNFR